MHVLRNSLRAGHWQAAAAKEGLAVLDVPCPCPLSFPLQVDDYLDREDLDASLEDLRTHRLAFTKQTGRIDNMARNVTDNVDDYVVVRGRLGSFQWFVWLCVLKLGSLVITLGPLSSTPSSVDISGTILVSCGICGPH